ncbi:MAG TPA: hypothetical protein VGA06_00480 [Candidatus Paceibacterota bacterium]|jgi:hypothetical protein
MDLHFFLILVHIVGTVLGVGGATFAEIFLLKSLRDGVVDPHETSTLRTVYMVLRIGLTLAIISGFGFLVLYRLEGHASYLYNEALWAKIVIILVILVNALVLTAHRVPMWLGSALSLTSWYAALIVGYLIGPGDYGFFEILGYYVVAVAGVAAALFIVRRLIGIHY